MRPRRNEAPFVLALDVGSSSVKGCLYDAQARPVVATLTHRPTTLRLTPDGGASADPGQLARTTEAVVDEVLSRGRGRPIAAVALDTLAFTTCGLDGQGRPLTPLYTYADTRSGDDARALAARVDVVATYQRTGTRLHSSYLPARVLWLERTRPELVQRVARFVDIATFLYTRWFRRSGAPPVPVSYSMASWSGLLDRRRLCWDAELLRRVGLHADSLPPLAELSTAQQGLAARYGRRWPALREAPFFLGVADGAAANVGSGCVSPRRLALTVGTSGALRMMLPPGAPAPEIPTGLWAYKVAAAETLLGGAFNEGGNLFAWATSVLRVPRGQQLEQALARLPPAGHGLTVLPFIAGVAGPASAPFARAAIQGFGASTGALQIVQACLEAVSLRFGLVARLLAPHLAQPHQVVASGGAMGSSPYWVQLMADVLQQPVLLSRETELTSRGAAILALRALGRWSTLEDVPLELQERYEPDARRAALYQAAMHTQNELYDALVGGGAAERPSAPEAGGSSRKTTRRARRAKRAIGTRASG